MDEEIRGIDKEQKIEIIEDKIESKHKHEENATSSTPISSPIESPKVIFKEASIDENNGKDTFIIPLHSPDNIEN